MAKVIYILNQFFFEKNEAKKGNIQIKVPFNITANNQTKKKSEIEASGLQPSQGIEMSIW